MPFINRNEIIQRLRESVDAGRPLLGCGAGTGISAKFAERGGADIIIIYNSGRFRMAGRGSMSGLMPYGDANAIVVDMAKEVLPVVEHTPVLAGVCGTDPFRLMRVFLRELKDMGFDGVQNFPTVGLMDGQFRKNLEETGISFQLEIDMIALAHEMDMLTCPYVFSPGEAEKMAAAGADIVVAHMGTTNKGSIGAVTTLSLEESARRIQEIRNAAAGVNKDILVICHGGPIAEPRDAEYIFQHTEGCTGFFGASSIERLAAEPAIEGRAREFKELRL